MYDIKELIDDAMKRNNLSKAGIARQLRVSHTSIYHWEIRRTFPTAEHLAILANLTDRDPEKLILESFADRAKTRPEKKAWNRIIQRVAPALLTFSALAGSGLSSVGKCILCKKTAEATIPIPV
jgi:transcriptional regulator with XRE-family HTH domain